MNDLRARVQRLALRWKHEASTKVSSGLYESGVLDAKDELADELLSILADDRMAARRAGLNLPATDTGD